MTKYRLTDYPKRGVMCRLPPDQFHYLVKFAERRGISMSLAVQRMVEMVRTLEAMPEVLLEDDLMLSEAAENERRKGGV